MADDTIVFDVSAILLECARVGLEDAGLEAPCRVCVVPGEIAVDTCADGGQLVIATSRVFYSNIFPVEISQDTTVPTPCGQGIVVAEMTLSLMRCAPGATGVPPRPPTCAALQASARAINQDGYVLRSSVLCCLSELLEDGTLVDFRLGGTTIQGPEGGCVGNVMTILVGLVSG